MKKKIQNKNSNYSLAHVLYQKLGSEWYAFTEKDGDCFMTKLDAEAVAEAQFADDSQDDVRERRRAVA